MKHVFRFIGTKTPRGWELEAGESNHALKVVQLRVGERFELADGRGNIAQASVIERTKRDFVFRVDEETFVDRDERSIDIYCAAVKPGVFDDVIPGAVELGVRRIVVFAQDRGEFKKLTDKVKARWQRIVDEAFKQSKRAYNAEIVIYEDLARALADAPDYASRFMLDETSSARLDRSAVQGPLALVIGSEAGLSETSRAAASGFQPVSIATNVLRVRTAVLAGLAIFSHELL